MSKYKEGDEIELYSKETGELLGTVKATLDCCDQILSKLIYFKLNIEPKTYNTKIKRKKR